MIPLLAALGCSGSADPDAPTLPVAAEATTLESLAALGSYRLSAEVRRTTGPTDPPQASVEAVELRWQDLDHWSYTSTRDAHVRSHVVVWDAVAFAAPDEGALTRRGDAEPWRVQLSGTWDPWAWGLEGLARSLELEKTEVDVVEGRRAWRYKVVLAPEVKGRRTWVPTAVDGEVWIDEATAVRLKGHVEVDAAAGARTQHTELDFAFTGIGEDAGVSAPGGDKR